MLRTPLTLGSFLKQLRAAMLTAVQQINRPGSHFCRPITPIAYHWFLVEDVVHVESDSPIMYSSSGVLAALHFNHKQREEQEEQSHAKANAVHGPVANQHVTVHMAPHTRKRGTHPIFTKAWNLGTKTNGRLAVALDYSICGISTR